MSGHEPGVDGLWTRRQTLQAGTVGAASGLVALVAATRPRTAVPGTTAGADVQAFRSRPRLRPPRVTVRTPRSGHPRPGTGPFTFVGARSPGPGSPGAMILDATGGLVWFGPLTSGENPTDVRVARYGDHPVLTWWQGGITHGHGAGVGVLTDENYRRVRQVRARDGDDADLHEFLLTPDDTAVITVYRLATADLRHLGGAKDGTVLAGVVQEIDIDSGELLFQWNSLDHVPVSETRYPLTDEENDVTYGSPEHPFDYFHLNSVAVADDGDIVISARHTSTVYKLDRASGAVRWRLGGPHSDFTLGPGARFAWQHDARPHGAARLTLFDNAARHEVAGRDRVSRALVLALDVDSRRARLVREIPHPEGELATTMGNVEVLPDGGFVIGWGSSGLFSHHGGNGEVLFSAALPDGCASYRAFSMPWEGRPVEPPAVGVAAGDGGTTVYASWNGATEVRAWTVLAGASSEGMRPVGTAPRSGFETGVTVPAWGPYFAVQALDAAGRVLAESRPHTPWAGVGGA